MSKRSNFQRVAKDFYRSFDPIAVKTLLPHLPKTRFTYCEPCFGMGDLVLNFDRYAPYSVPQAVFEAFPALPGQMRVKDALWLSQADVYGCDFIITNPPWSRDLLHEMINRFSILRPTWLLFDADWAHTRQSAEYMHLCRKIVSIGRMKWIPHTKMTGKDNVCWYLFDAVNSGKTDFIGRST